MPTCPYCDKTFSRQSTLDIHMCEPKRRYDQKDNKVHVLAFEIFKRFYEINYSNQKAKQFVDFANSQYYKAFIKTAQFITTNTPVEIGAFIDWLCTSKIRIDSWPKQSTIDQHGKEIDKGIHTVEHTISTCHINVIVYGWNYTQGYAYPAGYGMNPVGGKYIQLYNYYIVIETYYSLNVLNVSSIVTVKVYKSGDLSQSSFVNVSFTSCKSTRLRYCQ